MSYKEPEDACRTLALSDRYSGPDSTGITIFLPGGEPKCRVKLELVWSELVFIANSAHLPSYAELDRAELVAVCDIIPERAQAAAARYNIPYVFTDYREMLAKADLDVVSVCTPQRHPCANHH